MLEKFKSASFANEYVNTSRQPSLDLIKAVLIVLFSFTTLQEVISFEPLEPLNSIITFLNTAIVSPLVVFLVGIIIAYFKDKDPNAIMGMSIRIIAVSFVIIIFAVFMPYIIGYCITGNYMEFIDPLQYSVLGNDTFSYIAFALLFFAIAFRFKWSDRGMLIVGIIISVLGEVLVDLNVHSNLSVLNALIGYFIGTNDNGSRVASAFPFLNWILVTVLGYLFGCSLKRVNDKKRFYKAVHFPSLILSIAFLCLWRFTSTGMFGPYSYMHLYLHDDVGLVVICLFLVSVAFFIQDFLYKKTNKTIKVSCLFLFIAYSFELITASYIRVIVFCNYRRTGELAVLAPWQFILLDVANLVVCLLFSRLLKKYLPSVSSKIKKISLRIGQKFLLGFIIFSIIISVACGYFVGVEFWKTISDYMTDNAFAALELCNRYIDPDRIGCYLEGAPLDDYYYQTDRLVHDTAEVFALEYVYIVVCDPDNYTNYYVWDSDVAGELGYAERYREDNTAYLLGVFDGNVVDHFTIDGEVEYGYLSTAYYPIFNADNEFTGLLCADICRPDMVSFLLNFAMTIFVCIMFVVIISIAAFFYLIRKNMIYPLDRLTEATKNMIANIENPEDVQIDIKTGDEIEILADSFRTMNYEVRDYIQKNREMAAEKEHLHAELSIAKEIQESMLPHDFPENRNVSIYAFYKAAKEVGGDFYDFFMIDEYHLAFVIGDVSGKGIPASLFMVIAKTLIKDNTEPGVDLDKVFATVNNMLLDVNDKGFFVSALEGILDLRTGEILYVNAGHEPPFIVKADGSIQKIKPPVGLVLACMPDIKYTVGSITLEPGDSFLEYTDGVTEATDTNNNLFGFDGLEKTLQSCKGMPPKETLSAINGSIDKFVGDAPQFDDITMFCLEFKEKMEPLDK